MSCVVLVGGVMFRAEEQLIVGYVLLQAWMVPMPGDTTEINVYPVAHAVQTEQSVEETLTQLVGTAMVTLAKLT